MSIPWSQKRSEGGDTQDLRADFILMHNLTAGIDHPLGNMPLVVLSKTPGIEEDEDYTKEQLRWNAELQDQLANLSTRGEHIVASNSGHHIQIEQPDLVIRAIRTVLAATRQSP
jgi:pimeloyl-ACP methyl ester carboxylesterase